MVQIIAMFILNLLPPDIYMCIIFSKFYFNRYTVEIPE